jgi:hypothetical protein
MAEHNESAQSSDDFKSQYDDLVRRSQQANSDKQKRLDKIRDDIKDLFDIVCDPDPPGCSGPDRPTYSFEELCVNVQNANSAKKELLTKISEAIEALYLGICQPDPPGCAKHK